jgi:hypothetical protein
MAAPNVFYITSQAEDLKVVHPVLRQVPTTAPEDLDEIPRQHHTRAKARRRIWNEIE